MAHKKSNALSIAPQNLLLAAFFTLLQLLGRIFSLFLIDVHFVHFSPRRRRWTRNPLGSPCPGSNPADYVDYCIWRVARDCRLSQGDALSQVRSSFQIPLLTGVSLPVARGQSSFEKNW